MTKPHDQVWVKSQEKHGAICDAGTGQRVASTYGTVDQQAVLEQFICDAPAMARALLAQLAPQDVSGWDKHTRECLYWRTANGLVLECKPGCAEAMAALRESGVLQ